ILGRILCAIFKPRSPEAADPGLQKTLEEEIVPRLLAGIPGQPAPEELAADPLRHRFTLVFDREGYSPDLFSRRKAQRIAVLTYHKNPGADWGQSEFTPQILTHPNGEKSMLQLAERGEDDEFQGGDRRGGFPRAALALRRPAGPAAEGEVTLRF
ncbi:MAG: putative transposase, partial [Verrucomicrobiota bacterium]